ncbi:integral membrane protein [Paenibacillus phyllosphaerae]|uniref:Integral membrane protein n=1 Tax=Paenibacillus phyllosphaerae TaxID=274593 RepID=A0A7W5AYR5_9BACL|nr:DUF3817 domain-containing protein [Paenibacillus phyllosphaerae]MBB3111245.1 integral membrane protein [Paenibacillus phyllosphaerae]
MLKTAVGRFRVIAFVEGLSFLILLFIAMPLKYWADMPGAVTVTGGIHGALFGLYMLAMLHAAFEAKWRWTRLLLAFVLAFIPFGTFYLDAKLRKQT